MVVPARKSGPSVRFGDVPVSQPPDAVAWLPLLGGAVRLLMTTSESRNGSSGFRIGGSSKPAAAPCGVQSSMMTPCGM